MGDRPAVAPSAVPASETGLGAVDDSDNVDKDSEKRKDRDDNEDRER
jgi:hypothetical protein